MPVVFLFIIFFEITCLTKNFLYDKRINNYFQLICLMYNFITPSLVINASNNMYNKLNNIINIRYNVYPSSIGLKIFSKILSKIGQIINPFIFFSFRKMKSRLKTRENTRGIAMRKIVRH